RSDEDEARGGAGLGEGRVLREEAIARVHGVAAGRARCPHDAVDRQVALGGPRRPDSHRPVGHEHVERLAVRLRIDGDGRDAELAAGPDDAHRDLAAVGDEDFLEGRGHNPRMIAGGYGPRQREVRGFAQPPSCFSASSRNEGSTTSLTGSTSFMNPCLTHHAICFSISGTRSRPLRSWYGRPSLITSGLAPV